MLARLYRVSQAVIPLSVESWLTSFTSASTRKTYGAHVRRFGHHLASLKATFEKATPEQVLAAVNDILRHHPNMSARSWNVQVSVVCSCYSALLRGGVIQRDPTIHLRTRAVPDVVQPTPSPAEVEAMWRVLLNENVWNNATPNNQKIIRRDRAIFAILVTIGLRNQELCNLRAIDFNLEKRELVAHTKGGKQQRKKWPSEVHELIRTHVENYDGMDFVFQNRSRGQISEVAVNNILHTLCTHAKTSRIYTAHAFRRFLGTESLNAGVPLERVQRQLGHADPKTTMSYSAVRRDPTDDGGSAVAALTMPKGKR